MKTKRTNIWFWLHSHQYTHGTPLKAFDTVDEYVLHTEGIVKKINSLLDTIYGLDDSPTVLQRHRDKVDYASSYVLLEKLNDHLPLEADMSDDLYTRMIDFYRKRIGDIIAIRNAVGVYGIYPPNQRILSHGVLWYKEKPAYQLTELNEEGKEWLDYFGDDNIIAEGGWVVVSLSGNGIEYLNGIAKGVSSLSSSLTTTVTE